MYFSQTMIISAIAVEEWDNVQFYLCYIHIGESISIVHVHGPA